MRERLCGMIVFGLLLGILGGGQMMRVQAAPPNPQLEELKQAARVDGTVRVIVQLALPFQPEATLAEAAAATQRAEIQRAQDALVNELMGENFSVVRAYKYVPAIALSVDEAALDVLAASPRVRFFNRDQTRQATLFASLPLIGAHVAWAAGASGQGQVVAVIDSGVEKTNKFLQGQVIAEGCFSTALPGITESLCPNGATSSTKPNSGLNCDNTIPQCDHGTHVAGIVAGKPTKVELDVFGEQTISGVAPHSKLIAIQAFTKITLDGYCGQGVPVPCIVSFDSDQIAALEYVYELRHQHPIVAVNMSLGGGEYQTACDANAPYYKAIIDTLRAANISTIIASGNNGYANAIAFPACISSAISVGSTNTLVAQYFQVGNEDMVSSFTNINNNLNLLAPGNLILSAIPDNTFGFKGGTSMAAPTVAGAWATLKSQAPNANVDEILHALVVTGKPVKDFRFGFDGVTKPRINVDKALWELKGCTSAPRAPTWTTPASSATVQKTKVTLRWSPTECAMRYRYVLRQGAPSGALVENKKFVGATSAKTTTLERGETYSWRVRACNVRGCAWSEWSSFTVGQGK